MPHSKKSVLRKTYDRVDRYVNKKSTLLTGGLLVLANLAHAGYTDTDDYVVSQQSVPVVLQQGDRVEYGVLQYTAMVRKFEQQTGSSSKLDHPIDDRECNWNITGFVERHYSVLSLTQHDDGQAAYVVILPVEEHGKSNGLASIFDHDPCKDYRGQINRMIAKAEGTVAEVFSEYIIKDLETFKQHMTGLNVTVTPRD